MLRLQTYLRFCLAVLLSWGLFRVGIAQHAPAFYPDVYAIATQKCAPCHQKNGSAPFPLLDYDDFEQRGDFVAAVTNARYMPPWPADPSYRHFGNEIRLTQGEIELIAEWVEGGMVKGGKKSGKKESFVPHSKPDTILDMGSDFEVPGDGRDRFVYFLLPDTLRQDLHANGFQFFPGNRQVVHHVELLAAAPGLFPGVEARQLTEEDYFGEGFEATFGRGFEYISGWLPGNTGERYPAGAGMTIERGSRLILMVHYAPSPVSETDRTRLGIFLSDDPPTFPVVSEDVHGESDLVDGPLFLEAGTVRSFHGIREVREDLNAFAIFPHAHHLCTSMEAYAVTAANDTIPLLRIPKWDFDWQFTYYLPDYLFLPAGTEVHFLATYDNSPKNPENPFHPPRDISSSFKSEDEMMELFIWGIRPSGDSLPPLSFD